MDNKHLLQEGSKDEGHFKDQPRWRQRRTIMIIFPWILNLLLSAAFLWAFLKKGTSHEYRDQGVYSPVQHLIKYETKVFTSAFGSHKSKYQGPPSPAVDEAWDELYNAVGISRIDTASASQLPNKTVQIPGDAGHYIVGLDVFHQLHCLNHIRMLIWPEHYQMLEKLADDPAKHQEEVDHLDHCVDMLRQSLMCHSDISTLYWEWFPSKGRALAHADTTHTCRNFEAIWDWAQDHRMKGPFDSYTHVGDDVELAKAG